MSVLQRTPRSRKRRNPVLNPTVAKIRASEQELNRTGTEFLKIDVATAQTFAKIALDTEDPAKKRRNQKSARKAYDTILRLAKKITLSDQDVSKLEQELRRLKADLIQLGEAF
jgi:phage shock protein A